MELFELERYSTEKNCPREVMLGNENYQNSTFNNKICNCRALPNAVKGMCDFYCDKSNCWTLLLMETLYKKELDESFNAFEKHCASQSELLGVYVKPSRKILKNPEQIMQFFNTPEIQKQIQDFLKKTK